MERAETSLPGVEEFARRVDKALIAEPSEFVILVIDIGEVLTANLSHGWNGGNVVIETQASRAATLLPTGNLWHLGGDMFAAVFAGAPPAMLIEHNTTLCERISEVLSAPIPFEGTHLPTAVGAWHIIPNEMDNVHTLVARTLSTEGRRWDAMHRRAKDLFESAGTLEELAAIVAREGATALRLRCVHASLLGRTSESGHRPDRAADFRLPLRTPDAIVESWVHDEGLAAAPDLALFGEPIAVALDAKLELLTAITREQQAGDTDHLTGLLNRRGFLRRVEDLEGPFTVVLVDLDRLKLINDTYGHAEGDRALCRTAGLLLDGRSSDVVGRWGGEEFVVALPGTPPEGAAGWLRRLNDRSKLEAPEPSVTFSAGVAVAADGAGVESALELADAALYRAKDAGRATVVIA